MGTTLRAAYGEGLLSHGTFVDRVDHLLSTGRVEPDRLVGDLTLRRSGGRFRPVSVEPVRRLVRFVASLDADSTEELPLLALDWGGVGKTLLIGREEFCDVQLTDRTVSRQHARLHFRDGSWIVQDLNSKNGTVLNGRPVGRAQLRPGDQIAFSCCSFRVD